MTTSARDTMPASSRLPSASAKSRATDALPAFIAAKNPGSPPRAPSRREVDSILTTRAPAPASNLPTRGPAHRADRSATTSPATDRSGVAGRIRRAVIPRAVPPRAGTSVVVPVAGRRSPRTARGRPSSSARARSSSPPSPDTPASRAAQAPSGRGVDNSRRAGTSSQSVGRAMVAATQPSADRMRREDPPQLTCPRR